MSREEILAKVPTSWGDVRSFTEDERFALWDGKVIFDDELAVLPDNTKCRMYFVLAYDEDTESYVILKKLDKDIVTDLGVPPLANIC